MNPGAASIQDRDALIERVRPLADLLARYVHDHSPTGVARVLEPLDTTQLRALAIVLASMRRPQRTLPEDGIVDQIAVELAAAGERVVLTPTERRAAAARIVAAGHGPGEIAKRLRLSGKTARALYEQARGARAREGAAA